MIVRELLTRWKIVVDDKQLGKTNQKIKKTKKSLKELGQQSVRFGKTLSGFVTLPLLGLGVAFIKAASDAEETGSKFATIFQDMREESEATADQFGRDFGLSSTKSRELLGNTGDLLTGLGLTQKAALDLALSTNQLAVDLASFTNFAGGAEGASSALTKALLGEREAIKSLGISINENDIKARIKSLKAQGKFLDASDKQIKAQVTLQLAMEQSGNAIGDFARTSASFANRLRIFQARINGVAVAFGKILLPIATKLLNKLVTLFEFFEDLTEETKSFILVAGGLLAALGPVLFIVGQMAIAISGLIFLMGSFGITTLAALLPILVNFLLIAAAIAAVFLIAEDLFAFFRGDISLVGALIDKFTAKFPVLAKAIKNTFLFGKEIVLLFTRGIGAAFNSLLVFGQGLLALFKPLTDLIGSIVKTLAEGTLISFLGDVFGGGAGILRNIRERSDRITNVAAAQATGGGNNVSNVNLNMNSPISVPAGTPPEQVQEGVRQGVADVLGGMLRDTRTANESPISF